MLPCNPGGHAAFQDTFVSQFLKFYPDPFALPKSTWDYIVQFWYLNLSKLLPLLERWHLKPDNPFSLVFRLHRQQFLNLSIRNGLIDPEHLALAGDGTPVRTAAQQRKKRICECKEKGCSSCNCRRHYSQPDCNWGWDSHRECYFFGCHLYMYVASDSYSDLPVAPTPRCLRNAIDQGISRIIIRISRLIMIS